MTETDESTQVIYRSFSDRLFGYCAIATGLAMGVMMFWYGAVGIVRWYSADRLIETQAVVAQTHIDSYARSNNKTGAESLVYRAVVTFEITDKGSSAQSDVELGEYSDMDLAMDALQPYGKGEQATVFYNPDHPKQMHLSRDMPLFGPVISFLFGLIVIAACSYPIFVTLKIFLSSRRSTDQ